MSLPDADGPAPPQTRPARTAVNVRAGRTLLRKHPALVVTEPQP